MKKICKHYKKTLILFPLLIGIVSLNGCSNQVFEQPSPGVTISQLPSYWDHTRAEVLGHSVNSYGFKDFAYLKLNNFSTVSTDQYQDYILAVIQGMGMFKQLASTMPTIHINTPQDNRTEINSVIWYDAKDHYTVQQLRNKYPNQDGLVLDMTLREKSLNDTDFFRFGKKLSFDVKAIDLKTGEAVFYAQNQGRTWFGVDKTIVNPVLNQLKNWIVQTSGESAVS